VTTPTPKPRGMGLGQALAVGGVLWGATLLLVLGLDRGEWRTGFLTGIVTGGLGGAMGFALIVPTLGKPLKQVVSAMSLGFVGRMILVAAGLFLTLRKLHGEPLGFAFAFFFLFFVFAALELLVVVRHATPDAPAGQES
jgi:hypothetical protein